MIHECTSSPLSQNKTHSAFSFFLLQPWNLKVMITTETILSSHGVQMCLCTVKQNILLETEIYQWSFLLPFSCHLSAIQRKWIFLLLGLGTQLWSMPPVCEDYTLAHEQPTSLKGWFDQAGHLPLSVFSGGNKYKLLYVQLQAICLHGAVEET